MLAGYQHNERLLQIGDLKSKIYFWPVVRSQRARCKVENPSNARLIDTCSFKVRVCKVLEGTAMSAVGIA
jgi:hypothetical protein